MFAQHICVNNVEMKPKWSFIWIFSNHRTVLVYRWYNMKICQPIMPALRNGIKLFVHINIIESTIQPKLLHHQMIIWWRYFVFGVLDIWFWYAVDSFITLFFSLKHTLFFLTFFGIRSEFYKWSLHFGSHFDSSHQIEIRFLTNCINMNIYILFEPLEMESYFIIV